jgi:hypothetical protein
MEEVNGSTPLCSTNPPCSILSLSASFLKNGPFWGLERHVRLKFVGRENGFQRISGQIIPFFSNPKFSCPHTFGFRGYLGVKNR